MQTEKLIRKIEYSYEDFMKTKLKNKNFSLVFELPKITIKWNQKNIDDEQKKLSELSKKYNWFILNTTKTTKWTIVESVSFLSENDYLSFIWKLKDYTIFCKNIDDIKSSNISNLLFWSWNLKDRIEINIFKINEYNWLWLDILKVIEYFLLNQKSNLYFRELPIKIHTKFI